LSRIVHDYPDIEAMSRAVAEKMSKVAMDSVGESGTFSVALSGGNTPRTLYRMLSEEFSGRIPWDSTHIFFGDERYVPPDHPESNYAMAQETLVSKVPLPDGHLHPIQTQLKVDEASGSYDELLKDFFHVKEKAGISRTFDLVLLGIGSDGHTASLFPTSPALGETGRLAVPAMAPSTYRTRQRITLTLAAVNAARRVFFLVSGRDKGPAVREILRRSGTEEEPYPAGLVRPREEVTWFLVRDVL
jgi:6-phosphogluconolactonase